MSSSGPSKSERRAKARDVARAGILEAARRVAAREGARNLSLRSVAAEAGFAPAGLYGYFASKNDLLIALAAEDLGGLARAMRAAAGASGTKGGLSAAIATALAQLESMETMAAASAALSAARPPTEPERHFNGRLIAALNALSQASGAKAESREQQRDVVLLAAALTGIAVLVRSGRLTALGFTPQELIERLDARFARTI
jgi:AcrR family transcriptional regulator